jgi:uncharacterized protein (DUF433 family)
MEWQQHITAEPAVLGGKPVIKGTRISVELVLECLGLGWTIDEFLTQYPHVPRAGVIACLDYARDLVRSETVTALRAG